MTRKPSAPPATDTPAPTPSVPSTPVPLDTPRQGGRWQRQSDGSLIALPLTDPAAQPKP